MKTLKNNFTLQINTATPSKQVKVVGNDDSLTQQHSFQYNQSTKANSSFERSWLNAQTLNESGNKRKRFHSAHRHQYVSSVGQKDNKKIDNSSNVEELSYDYRGEYYPPPKHLHHHLAGKIKQILHRDNHEDFKALLNNIETKRKEKSFLSPAPKTTKSSTKKQQQQYQEQQLKQKKISHDIYSHAYEKVKDDEIFIDPSQYDLFKTKKFSKIQEQYIREYQDQMEKDKNEKGYLEHPEMVDNLLYYQLSASAIASHKWQSKRAQMNIFKLKPQSKGICDYPLSPRVVQEINAIEKKRDFRKNMILKVTGVDLRHEKVKDNLTFDLNQNSKDYMKNLEKVHEDKKVVYGDNWDEYLQILDYKQTLDQKSDNHETDQAYSDFQFIKKKRSEFISKKIEEDNIEYQKKLEEQERIEYLNDFYGNCQKNEFQPLPRQRIIEREKRAQSLNMKNGTANLEIPSSSQIQDQQGTEGSEVKKTGYQDDVYLVKPKQHLKTKIKMKFFIKE